MANFLTSYLSQLFYNLIQGSSSTISYFKHYFRAIDVSPELLSAPDKCRFRLDSNSSDTLTLPDGRDLGYTQYGAENGAAVFYLHGLPGSRLEVASFDMVATKLGVRIISIDRPGIGLSSPHPNRSVLDHAKDLEHLATHLNIGEYGVLGISGGGPYALACARALPTDKLKVVSIVCGLGPRDMGYSGMIWTNWLGFSFAQHYFPGLCRWWISRDTVARLDLSDEERMKRLRRDFETNKPTMHPKDAEVFGDADSTKLLLRSSREAFAQGTLGFSQDARLVSCDLGFRIEDIRKDLPVQLWYGKLDKNVPLRHGEQIAQRLGRSASLRVEDDTHASISTRREEILEQMVKVM